MEQPVSDTTPNVAERPSHACITCPPPRTNAWRAADPSYKTCSDCYDRLRDLLKEIDTRYTALDATPGASGEVGGRGAPGFSSKPAASLHVIAMRDHRSSTDAHTWVGRDGRVHQESEQPVRSVFGVLDTIAWTVAEVRGVDGPATTAGVGGLCRFVDRNIDWLTRQDLVADVAADLRSLAAQLRPVTGEPGRRHIGLCPTTLDEGDTTRECKARLYAPLRGDVIHCNACGERWPRETWLRLGGLLESA
jgi:hypothetical protein